jgi:hypothetical protein
MILATIVSTKPTIARKTAGGITISLHSARSRNFSIEASPMSTNASKNAALIRMTILPPVVLTSVAKAGSATLVVLSMMAINAPAPLLSKIKALAGVVKNSSEQIAPIEPTPSKINCRCLLETRIHWHTSSKHR